jgi:hypothetical protein
LYALNRAVAAVIHASISRIDFFLFIPSSSTLSAKHLAPSMRETTINIIDALRGQQEQLKRLLAQKVLISNAPRPDLSEIAAQIIEIKRLLAEFEKAIQDQLQRGQ